MKPLEIDYLRKMSQLIKPQIKDYFMLLLMTVAMLRESEAVTLKPEDVECLSIENEECLVVRVAKQTTKVRGNTILIAMSTDKRVCPIFWFKLLASRRDKQAKTRFHTISNRYQRKPPTIS
jgi:hypothetical protein